MSNLNNAKIARRDPAVRAARKQAQLARLAAKGREGYSEKYAAQPEQVRIKAKQTAERQAARAVKVAQIDQALNDAAGGAAAFDDSTEQETD